MQHQYTLGKKTANKIWQLRPNWLTASFTNKTWLQTNFRERKNSDGRAYDSKRRKPNCEAWRRFLYCIHSTVKVQFTYSVFF